MEVELRQMASADAGMLDLIKAIHEREGAPLYSARASVVYWFRRAFGLLPTDLNTIVFACTALECGGSLEVAEAERLFRARITELMKDRQSRSPSE